MEQRRTDCHPGIHFGTGSGLRPAARRVSFGGSIPDRPILYAGTSTMTSSSPAPDREPSGPDIPCSGRTDILVAWFMAVVIVILTWTLHAIAVPRLGPVLPDAIDLATVALLAAIAITLLAGAAGARATLQWVRLGPAALRMDPWPAGVGGEAGGVIVLNARPSLRNDYEVSLQCVERRRTGSGSNRSWSERVLWENQGRPTAEADSRGTRLTVRFRVPAERPASLDEGDRRIVWRLYLLARFGRSRFERCFTLPLTDQPATGSRRLSRYPFSPDIASPASLAAARVRESMVAEGTRFLFPAGRSVGAAAGFGLFALMVGATGGGFYYYGQIAPGSAPPLPLTLVLLAIAALLALPALWLPLASLQVTAGPGGLAVRRRWAGIPLWHRTLAGQEISDLDADIHMQARRGGGPHHVFYRLHAVTDDGRRLLCGERLPGRPMIDLYRKRLLAALGRRA